jgi:hypothetical protein
VQIKGQHAGLEISAIQPKLADIVDHPPKAGFGGRPSDTDKAVGVPASAEDYMSDRLIHVLQIFRV